MMAVAFPAAVGLRSTEVIIDLECFTHAYCKAPPTKGHALLASTHRHRKLDDNWSVYMDTAERCPVRVEVYMTSKLADALVSEEMWRLDGLGNGAGIEAPSVALGDVAMSALRRIAEGAAR